MPELIPNTLVKLSEDVCFTSRSGGRRLRPIGSATLESEGKIPAVLFTSEGRHETVTLEKKTPYLFEGFSQDPAYAIIFCYTTGHQILVSFSLLEQY